jgi:hypothetical protein
MKKRKKRSPEERAADEARADFQVKKLRELAARKLGIEPDQLDAYFMGSSATERRTP